MNQGVSFIGLAPYYDLIYRDKDYEKEADFLEEIFENTYKPRNILEVGCGTGNYTRILVDRGYEVTALDTSENMLEVARGKCGVRFIHSDVRDMSINDTFDACIAMFTVMGYITENADITRALTNVHKHLKPDGILIFDVWNGLAVMRILPEPRVKEVENDSVKVIRIAMPNLRAFDHICEVNYRLIIWDKQDHTFDEINERHIVRFFFPQEMKHYLEETGFEVLSICPFLDLRERVDENIWNMSVIARARL